MAGVALAGFLAPAPAAWATGSCSPAGSTGLTAAMVVTANLSNQSIDATGCDVGIYVPPGTSSITISGVTVSGANDHGIFVQDASGITISGSTVKDNGVARSDGIADDKALMMVGTSNSTITGNTVTGNLADGGIGVFADGKVDEGAPRPGTSSPATGDTISKNKVSGNYGGCAIVVSSPSANVPAAAVSDDVVSGNTLTDTPGRFGPHGPAVGGVIIAGRSTSNITVTGNTITGAAQPGVVIHSNAPGDTISGVRVTDNTMSADDWLDTNGPPAPTAIVVGASPIPPPATPVLTGTTITGNTISGEHFGVWISGATSTTTSPNTFSLTQGGRAVFTTPSPGSGYWMAGAAGGIFSFGQASFLGSAGAASPVVGMAPTLDQGGYWTATASGDVSAFGDATPHGSLAGRALRSPVVGIAATPYIPAPGGDQASGGMGYWLVGAGGGVFSFGDAHFFGSMGAKHLNSPVVAMAATPDGHGYWLVGADGGVFSFGDAHFFGSMGAKHLAKPVVSMAATPDGHGYWLVGADGGVFSFGDAHFFGSMGARHLNSPVVAMAPVGLTMAG